MSVATSVSTTTAAREFGRGFAADHPDLPPIGVGEPCRAAWLADGGAVWAGRVAAMEAATARVTEKHRVRMGGPLAP